MVRRCQRRVIVTIIRRNRKAIGALPLRLTRA